MRKTFVRDKENYSLAKKEELGELVEKYKKEDDKEVKQKGTLLTLFQPPGYSNTPAYYILHKFPTPCLLEPPVYSGIWLPNVLAIHSDSAS